MIVQLEGYFCRNISQALHWTRKGFGVCIPISLRVAQQQQRKLSNSLEIWHKYLCVMRNQVFSLWRTLPKYHVYWGTQKFLNPLRTKEGNSLISVLIWLMCLKSNEIYVHDLDAQRVVSLKNGCSLPRNFFFDYLFVSVCLIYKVM